MYSVCWGIFADIIVPDESKPGLLVLLLTKFILCIVPVAVILGNELFNITVFLLPARKTLHIPHPQSECLCGISHDVKL